MAPFLVAPRTTDAFLLPPVLNLPLPGLRFAFVWISGWPFEEAECLCSVSSRKCELAGDEWLQGLPSPLGMKRQTAELRSGDCFVAENVMLMLLDISSEEEARLKPFFMLLQSL